MSRNRFLLVLVAMTSPRTFVRRSCREGEAPAEPIHSRRRKRLAGSLALPGERNPSVRSAVDVVLVIAALLLLSPQVLQQLLEVDRLVAEHLQVRLDGRRWS